MVIRKGLKRERFFQRYTSIEVHFLLVLFCYAVYWNLNVAEWNIQISLNAISKGELSDPPCDSINRNLTIFRLHLNIHRQTCCYDIHAFMILYDYV